LKAIGIEKRRGRDFLFITAPRPAVGPTNFLFNVYRGFVLLQQNVKLETRLYLKPTLRIFPFPYKSSWHYVMLNSAQEKLYSFF
jgi:hypothetical protein